MKKIIFTGLTGLFLVLVMNMAAKGQSAIAKAELPKDMIYHRKSVPENNFTIVPRSEVNQKAVKNFTRSYKGQSDEVWHNVTDGFIAHFTSGDINYRVDYDKKGNWLHTIRTYDESKLPRDVRHMVKSIYYDFDITQVQEIESPLNVENPLNAPTYIIHLEGKKEFINLRVCDGEMDEWQKFYKSK